MSADSVDKGLGDFDYLTVGEGKMGQPPTGKTGVRVWESLTAYADTAANVPDRCRDYFTTDREWSGGTLDNSVKLAREGWGEIRDDVERIKLHVTALTDAETVSDTFGFTYDVAGQAIDMGRYMEGQPECMLESVLQPVARKGKVVRVLVPVDFTSEVEPKQAMRRGAGIVALVDSLAKAHYTLEVWAIMSGKGSGSGGPSSYKANGKSANRWTYIVKVASAAMPYDPAAVAFGLGHCSMLRRLAFSVLNQENDDMRAFNNITDSGGGSYGGVSRTRLTDLPMDSQTAPTIVLPDLDSRTAREWDTDEKIATWINEQVARIVNGDDNLNDREW